MQARQGFLKPARLHANRKWQILLLWMSILGFAGSVPAADEKLSITAVEQAVSRQQATDIEVFVREGCPHCAKAEQFLAALALERPELKIVIRDIYRDPAALDRLQEIAKTQQVGVIRIPAFYLRGQLLIGYTDEATTGKLILDELSKAEAQNQTSENSLESCAATTAALACQADSPLGASQRQIYEISFLGRRIALEQVGLPLFTVAMGVLDGFNPCSMWVLILMISLLAPLQNRMRMFAVAGTFIVVEGLAYFIFMAAWLNLFLLIGFSRASEIAIAGIALFAGAINLKDFWAYGRGISLTIPKSAKPGIYARMRNILHAENLWGAMIGAVLLAVLVQLVEFLCTSGFPALYTRILTLQQLDSIRYYGYLALYNLAYMFDDLLVLGIGVVTLSQRRLQEREGRWLKFISGMAMVGLGLYLLIPLRW